jgi:hypothetical protein
MYRAGICSAFCLLTLHNDVTWSDNYFIYVWAVFPAGQQWDRRDITILIPCSIRLFGRGSYRRRAVSFREGRRQNFEISYNYMHSVLHVGIHRHRLEYKVKMVIKKSSAMLWISFDEGCYLKQPILETRYWNGCFHKTEKLPELLSYSLASQEWVSYDELVRPRSGHSPRQVSCSRLSVVSSTFTFSWKFFTVGKYFVLKFISTIGWKSRPFDPEASS